MQRVTIGLLTLLIGCAAATPERVSPSARAVGEAPVPDSAMARRERFAAGHRAVAAGQYQEAIRLLEPLCPAYPELRDYCWRDLAISRARTGDPAGAEALWRRLVLETPQSVHVDQAQLELGKLRRDAGDPAAAQAHFAAARLSRDIAIATRARIELAALDAAAGNVVAADAELLQARKGAPGTPLGREAKERQAALRQTHPELVPRGAAQLVELRLLLAEGDLDGARRLANQLLASRAADPAEVGFLRAQAEIAAGDVEQGLQTLRSVARQYPGSPFAADAQYRAASLLWNRDRNEEARLLYAEFRERFPGDRRQPEALYALGRIAQGDGRDDEAVARYRELVTTYPASSVARDARWRIGWIPYRAGRYGVAAAAFAEAARAGSIDSVPEAYYWQARALERAGDADGAARLYTAIVTQAPANYYAGWAERRLGRAARSNGAVPAPPPPRAIGPAPPGTDPFHWQRAAELQAIDLQPLARAELQAFERTHPNGADPLVVIDAYQAVGGYRDAIRLGSARGYTDPAIFFPLAFWPQLSRHTAAHAVDPLFALALMRQESMFDPAARSPADARGLMQLLPSTAERVARDSGRPPPADLYDPETNIALGVAHLRELLDRYDGDQQKVLAAYNGGPHAVARWEQRFGDLPPDEFVESITYRETRDYVKRVLSNYRRYQQVYR